MNDKPTTLKDIESKTTDWISESGGYYSEYLEKDNIIQMLKNRIENAEAKKSALETKLYNRTIYADDYNTQTDRLDGEIRATKEILGE